MVFDPVCGCDGTTYDNDCLRQRAQVAKDHDGLCGLICGGIAGAPCPAGTYCEFECRSGSTIGDCVAIPSACPAVSDPVCGCDGTTYDNDCLRQRAQVAKDHDGPCARTCGGFVGIQCDPGEYCDRLAGACQGADLPGVCVTIPLACTAQFDPVCGCDGMTYTNDCHRVRAEVQLDHTGVCTP